ncbi:replication-relaxation family protein [Alcaligenaceae bacterium]|nr:replication-relaxation family protein [Alcaligenaceae bacterium]
MTISSVYSAEPNAHHSQPDSDSSCDKRDSDLSAETTFADKSLFLPSDASDSMTARAPAVVPKPPRHYAQSIDRGLTDKVAPTVLRERIRFIALQTIDEFRYVRTLDIAAACFAERPFPAALSAAQRAMRGMARDGLVQEYITDRHQHIYALTRSGAQWLNEHTGGEAAASTHHASELTNPEHTLYENFIKICCEQRGFTTQTERDLLDGLKSDSQNPIGGLLRVRTHTGSTKSLRPDVLSHDSAGAVWFEIDRSARGAARKQDLRLLLSSIGQPLSHTPQWLREEMAYLRHVVIHAFSPNISRAAAHILKKTHPLLSNPLEEMKCDARIYRACRLVTENQDAQVFEIWAWRKLTKPTLEWGQLPTLIGYVTIQLLPKWMSSYRSESKERLRAARGWFDDNYLPYARAPQQPGWQTPASPFLRSGYSWAELGL